MSKVLEQMIEKNGIKFRLISEIEQSLRKEGIKISPDFLIEYLVDTVIGKDNIILVQTDEIVKRIVDHIYKIPNLFRAEFKKHLDEVGVGFFLPSEAKVEAA